MLVEPVFDRDALLSRVQRHYRISGRELHFLSLGNDMNSAAYRLDAAGREAYFLKLRKGAFSRPSLETPTALQMSGEAHVIAPVRTVAGRLSIPFDGGRVALYPFVRGLDGFGRPLEEKDWRSLGRAVAALHALRLPSPAGLSTESYSPRWRRNASDFLQVAATGEFDDPIAAAMAALLVRHRDTIQALIHTSSRTAGQLRQEELPLVLTHGDIHAGNVLISESGELFVVDWDTLKFAPKERDLMFVGGGVGGVWTAPSEQRWFFEGYGDAAVDIPAIRYFRCERIIEDVVEYANTVLTTNVESPDRERGLADLAAAFVPGGVVDIAMRSSRTVDS